MLPLKASHLLSLQYKRYTTGSQNALRYSNRIQDNVARLYARRIIELAALSAASMASTTQMEGLVSIEKPKEWRTIDLVEQRRQFGQSISSLGKTKISRVWAAGSRIANLTLLASPLAFLAPAAYLTGSESKINSFAWDYSVWAIEQAGPTFIKLIQWATTRNDIFHPDFISHFSRLQNNTRGHTWKETEKILEDSFGTEYMDLFEFDSGTEMRQQDKISPIGSGCIAQVYKAKLKKDTTLIPAGSDVAIKVSHPHILHKVCVDFYILNKITKLLEAVDRKSVV